MITNATRRTPRRAAMVLLAVTLVAGACGSDSNGTASDKTPTSGAGKGDCASGSIAGAGSTFAATIVQQWIKDYSARCPGTVNYQSVGSGAGIQQFAAGTVDFAGSDVTMKPEEQGPAEAKVGPVVHIPWSSGAIAIEYNLKGVKNLKLTAEAVAGIFAGKITKWNDPAIAAENRDAALPATTIQVVHRSDGSGTTAAFTAYMTATAPSVWTLGSAKEVNWSTGNGAKGSDGVTAAVKQAEGGIGYAEVSYAKGGGLGVALIKNQSGAFVGPEGKAVAAALASSTVPTDLKIKVNYQADGAGAYLISTVTFVIVPRKPADPIKGKLMRSFILYALGAGQESADSLYYAALPADLLAQAKTAAESIGS